MAGSQLKQLKAALKEKGLTGQTNTKKSKKNARTGNETRRDDRDQILSEIRGKFNKFDTRTNRTKHDYTVIQGRKFVKAGLDKHSNSTSSRSKVQYALENQYNMHKSRLGKTGGVIDRRFGENNKGMTQEEKMLARFTKERERQSKKNVFSLGDDDSEGDDDGDDGDDGFVLTHYGKSLAIGDDNDGSDNDGSSKRGRDYDGPEDLALMPGQEGEFGNGDTSGPARKKTKAEVMKEIIAKSKFYKQQRQQEHQKTQNEILDLDDDFDSVMQDLNLTLAANKAKDKQQIVPKSQEQIEYDQKVRELTFDRRSVPADRSKTDEELAKDHAERLKKLETDRLNRMQGMNENRDAEGDDLGDNFWNGSEEEGEGDEEGEGFEVDSDASEDEANENTSRKPKVPKTLPIPSSHKEFSESISVVDVLKQASYIDRICELYHPRLSEGNKAKMGTFVGILFEHILYLADSSSKDSEKLIEIYIKKLKGLSEKYNEDLVTCIRQKIEKIEDVELEEIKLSPSNLVFFVVIGILFSTSDHHHLIVTPSLLLMNRYIASLQGSGKDISYCQASSTAFLIDTIFNYTSFAKRIDPEIINLLEKLFLILIPKPLSIGKESSKLNFKLEETPLNIEKSFKNSSKNNENVKILISTFLQVETPTETEKFNLLKKLLSILDNLLGIWRESSAFSEIIAPFVVILKHIAKFFSVQLPELGALLNKTTKLEANALKDRKPLTLQHHRALAIATFVPKFEENFNPDKKSYDVNRERQEINKMQAQLKKEKKSALKDIRKESRFVARESIKEKKASYEAYHKKMASIVNSISTVEGAEKNLYEKEKKERKNRK